MRRAAFVVGGVALAVVLAAAIVAVRLLREDPLAALPRELPGAAIVEREVSVERWNGRALVHVTLDGAAVGRVRFVLSLPDPLPSGRLPLVVVVGGLRGGSKAIRELSEVAGDPGPNTIAGFDWPLPAREPRIPELVLRFPALRRAALSVPGQLDAVLRWASRQPWADPARVSLLGFSLGGFVAPSLHLPHLRGRFLYVGGRGDHLIAPAAVERFLELVPEPRTVILVEGDHMGVGARKQRLLAEVTARTRSWLVDEGAIDTSRPAPGDVTSSRPSPPAPPRTGR